MTGLLSLGWLVLLALAVASMASGYGRSALICFVLSNLCAIAVEVIKL